jgi:DNA-binding phage protein
MFTHAQLWAAIDAIAEAQGLSVSALAKKAGLNATALGFSKRVSPDGHIRWPSTETLSRVLAAADMDLRALADIVDTLPE